MTWRTFTLPPEHAYASWKRCLWCGERGHWVEDCAKEHVHGGEHNTRDGICLGCKRPVCELDTASHHSKDMVAMHSGSLTPTYACGFHATFFAREVFARHRERQEQAT